MVTLSASLAQNAAKPAGTEGPAVWTMTRAEAQSIKRPAMWHAIDGIERGAFPVEPDEPFRCRWCGYASVCRKDYVGDE